MGGGEAIEKRKREEAGGEEVGREGTGECEGKSGGAGRVGRGEGAKGRKRKRRRREEAGSVEGRSGRT